MEVAQLSPSKKKKINEIERDDDAELFFLYQRSRTFSICIYKLDSE